MVWMTLFWGALAFFLTYYIILPICRFFWKGFRLYRQWRRATEPLRRAYEQAEEENRRRASGQPPAKRKKIDPKVGEYVKFEEIFVETEIKTDESGSETTRTTITVESQIEDAEWEDITP